MIDLLSKIAAFIFGGLLERRKQKKALSVRLETLKRMILYETLINNLTVHMDDLRIFFLEQALTEKPGFHEFFVKWLTHPVLTRHQPILGLFDATQIEEMRAELSLLKL